MKNIIVCFLTQRDSQEISKISNKYFPDFIVTDIDALLQFGFERNDQAGFLFFLPLSKTSNTITKSVHTLMDYCSNKCLPILLLDQNVKTSDYVQSFFDAFTLSINARHGFESAAALLNQYITADRHKNDYIEIERKYTTLVNNVQGVVYQCKNNSDYTMLFLSRKVEKLTGYNAHAFINNKVLTYSDIIIPGDREKIWLKKQKAIKLRKSFHLEYRIKMASGRIKWVYEQGIVIPSHNENMLLEGVIIDIDRVKKLEKRNAIIRNIVLAAYKTSDLIDLIQIIEKEIKKVVHAGKFGFALFDRDKREFLFAKVDNGEEYYEKIPMAKTLDALVIKKNRTVFLRHAEILKLERLGVIIHEGIPPKVWLGVPLKIRGKTSGIIIIQDFDNEFIIDRTDVELLDYVAAQIAVSIVKNRDEEKNIVLLRACDQGPVPAIVTDLDGRVVYANRIASEASGYSQREILGKMPNILEPYENEAEHFTEIWKALKNNDGWTGEYKNHRKDGTAFLEYARISAIKSSRGKTTHYLYLSEEITHRKQFEENLLKAKKHAEESDKLKTAFLANMSHEIRTPMNAIIGFTEMMQSEDFPPEEHQEFHQLILENSRKLLNTIDNIIDIARIEAGQMTIAQDRCSANKILYDNYYHYQKTKLKMDKAQIHFISKQYKKDENLLFYSDPVRINQVLDNLLENAFKYTSRGTIEFGYRLTDEDKRKYIDFYVKDSGSGISEQSQEMIFNRFAQIDNNYMSSVGGNGLGLSISRSIARLMNGDIRVKSHEGKGSVFHFLIPYIPAQSTGFALDNLKADQPNMPMQWPDKTVLIAEDEDANFKLLQIMLRKTQVKIHRAYNGKQAVDYVLGGHEVDMILMDIRMPVMNGYDATKLIKEFNPGLPVIIQTAFALTGDLDDCFGAGCDAFLSKPITATKLYKLMMKFLA